MPLTTPIDTPTRNGDRLTLPLAAGAVIYAGSQVSLSEGALVESAIDPDAVVVGRAQESVSNADGAKGDQSCEVHRGVHRFANSEADPVTDAQLFGACYVEDGATVAGSNAANTHVAGQVVLIADDGVWVDSKLAPLL